MRESKVYQLRNINFPKWMWIRKVTWVFRQKEWYSDSAIGIWWKLYTGLGIRNTDRELRYITIGLYLGPILTWLNFTYTSKRMNGKGLSVPEDKLDGYLRSDK